jgi:hypothetical protein
MIVLAALAEVVERVNALAVRADLRRLVVDLPWLPSHMLMIPDLKHFRHAARFAAFSAEEEWTECDPVHHFSRWQVSVRDCAN